MRRAERALAIAGIACAVVLAATVAHALWVSTTPVYSKATLGAKSTRVDTVVVARVPTSSERSPEKPEQYIIALGGTSQATSADSQYSVVVKAIRGGNVHQIGEDSLMLRPDPAFANKKSGETRIFSYVADSLQITTRNPRSTTVTGASLSVTAERLR
jgi:hypothetical protein